jgi:4-hydroxy-tetrahydrodipicolinate reductase
MRIILVGLPGKIASAVATALPQSHVHSHAVSSARHAGSEWTNPRGGAINLVASAALQATLSAEERYVALDFSPQALEHVELWAKFKIPVVIGATGQAAAEYERALSSKHVPAVLAPNLAIPLVALQGILSVAAKEFPGVFEGFSWRCTESHQQSKRDKSGTARTMLPAFQALGFSSASEGSIESVRDPSAQRALGVPEAHLGGHGWHRYEAERDGVFLALEHRANGREMYAAGALRACEFVDQWSRGGQEPRVFTMIDVLRGQR